MSERKFTQYIPAFLMTQYIVFVSVNYRVGVLGFLSLNDTPVRVQGNVGLKDLVLALRNIRKFEGDRRRVPV